MNALQDAMSDLVHFRNPFAGRCAPSQKNNTFSPLLSNYVNDFLGELLPALVGVAVSFMCSNCKTRIEQENATVCPRSEQAAFLGRRVEIWILDFEQLIYIC